MSEFTLHHGDCLEVMRAMPDNSVDAIVTDPPYELGFMGKGWDATGIANNPAMWAEALRVLKPGGHLLAFSGSRTYHRMACAIEDAGFEIRDQIMWLYGSGFPKSLDVSKAIDKAAGAEREIVGYDASRARPNRTGMVMGEVAYDRSDNGATITAPATDAARQWNGWGTALKPAHEPICMARKPLVGTVAANVLAHRTGALNIDACRVLVADADYARNCSGDRGHADNRTRNMEFGMTAGSAHEAGRWPANVVHDGSDEVVGLFPAKAGAAAPVKGSEPSASTKNAYGKYTRVAGTFFDDSGSAARFFYCAKASKSDRDEGLDDAPDRILAMSNQAKAELARGNLHAGESGMNTAKLRKNHHPTVKPTALMAWLVRLVTPAGGMVLDPFMGSGSTGKACVLEGFGFTGIEREAEYLAIARARIGYAEQQAAVVPPTSPQLGLFGEDAA